MDQSKELCLTCLLKRVPYINIFSKHNEQILADVLYKCTSIKVFREDALPKCICAECFSKLIASYQFRILCRNSHKLLLNEDHYDCNNELILTENIDVKNEIEEEMEIEKNNDCVSPGTGYQLYIHHAVQDKIGEIKYEEPLYSQPDGVKSKKNLPKTIKCMLCSKMFTFQYMLKSHMESHRESKSYFCSLCKKYYKSEYYHRKFHKIETKFICDICLKTFPTKGRITAHLQTHSNRGKKFKCDFVKCNKVYMSIQGYNRHKLVHSGYRNFMCHLCSKTFADKSGLLLHIQFHTNEKKYHCRICNKGFYTPSNRNQHEDRHKERKHPCQHCNKRFISKSILRRHMLSHTNERSYECEFCTKKFSRSDNKRRHLMCIHGYSDKKVKRFNYGTRLL